MPKVYLDPEKQEIKHIEIALRKLKKKVDDCGILKTLQEKAFYERPGIRKNRKKAAAIMRWKRDLAKQKLPEKMY
jgi:small subunit ribosomal protein S21